MKVRETLSRRFQNTQLWYRWKEYYQSKHGPCGKENGTAFEVLTLNSMTPLRFRHCSPKDHFLLFRNKIPK